MFKSIKVGLRVFVVLVVLTYLSTNGFVKIVSNVDVTINISV